MKKPLIIALATAVSLPLASAQDERKPDSPPPPVEAEHPPGPRSDGPRERRPDVDRPSPEAGERRDEVDRGPGQRRPDGPRPERDRRDGPRPEGGRRDGERAENPIRGDGDARPQARVEAGRPALRLQKPTAYLGVVTGAVPPPLAAQLGLADGFGLVVEDVIADAPAAKAGVQRFDVLKQFNDQILTDPNQLAALVRSAGKDADVSLTLIRKGAEQKVALKIGERLLPERRPFGDVDHLMRNLAPMRERAERGVREMREQAEVLNREFGERAKQYQERMKDYANRLREFHERMKDGRNADEAPPKAPEPPLPPAPPAPPQGVSPVEPAPADVVRPLRPGGAPRVRVEQDGNVTVWNTANARATLKDDEGEVELRSDDGKRTVTARDPGGKVIFSGPIDTDEQRAALPDAVRRKLERMDVKSSVRTDAPRANSGAIVVPPPVREREVQ